MPLCLVLRVLHAVSPSKWARSKRDTPLPRKILVVKGFGLGSILQMCPMFAALKESIPGVHITLLTFAENAQVVPLIPTVDKLMTVEFRKGFLRFTWDTLKGILAIRKDSPDAILDCEFFSNYVAIVVHLARRAGTRTIGFYRNGRLRDWIFSNMIAIDASQHVSRLFFKMLRPMGIQATYRPLSQCGIAPRAAARERAEQLLADLGITSQDLSIVVNVNASDLCRNRRWPRANFERLIHELLATRPYGEYLHFLLTGGPEDMAYVKDLCRDVASSRLHNLAGRTSIEELAALFCRADLFVGNDSGPLHLAVACGLRTVSFFGPETPNLYGPQGDRHRVIYSEEHCSPCLNLFYFKETHCTDNICMQAITPEAAFTAIDAVLREIPPPRA